MERSNPPARDLMYCHQCENEWYRDEHGLTCPECQSDFTEVIEPDHDPRQDDAPAEAEEEEHQHHQHHHREFYAEDPDEDDIDNLQWIPNPPGQPPGMRLSGTVNRTIRMNSQQLQQHQEQGGSGGLMGLLGSMVQSALGGGQQQQHQDAQRQQGQHMVGGDGRPASAPGGGSQTRVIEGPGYRMSITSSASGNLFPRNANQPQPFQAQPDHLQQMMQQMMMNIGVAPGMMFPGENPNDPHMHGPNFGPTPFTGAAGAGMPMPFANIFNMFGLGPGGVNGDAVYSQEALDRVISQLMEQHQTGNAPGPATDAAIKALPTRIISSADLGDNGKAECSICMDEVQLGTPVTELPCHHWFHHDCIKAWLGEHDTCPHCRQGIMPRDEPNTNRPRQPSQPALNDMRTPEFTRPTGQMPGAYGFSRQDSGDGSAARPFTVPESPTRSLGQDGGGSGGGIFSRMRDAFGGNGGGGSSGGAGGRNS